MKDYTPEEIEAAARAAHEVNRIYCDALGDYSQLHWGNSPAWQRDSATAGVLAVIDNPAVTAGELHGLWVTQKKFQGWVYGETKDPEKKTHPCMVPYEELPIAQRMKDTLFQATVRGVLGLEELVNIRVKVTTASFE